MAVRRCVRAAAVVAALLFVPLVPFVPAHAGARADSLTNQQMSWGGITRNYLLFVPGSYAHAGVAVVFHGLYANELSLLKYVIPTAAARGIVVAFPQGVDNSWNAGGCCSVARASHIDDVGFAHELITTLVAKYQPRRVVASGYSNGAMLAWLLACQPHSLIGGIVDASGTEGIPEANCTPSAPLTAVAVHGLQDPTVPYHGGSSPITAGVDYSSPFRAIPDVITEWGRDHDHCATSSQATTPGWSAIHWSSCAGGTVVSLYTIDGMGHSVPNYAGGEPVDFGALIADVVARS
jgi:polyhydroxybutyrate depolymerase